MSIKVYPEPLGSIFLTGPDGFIYEFPESLAKQYRVTPERIKELGHLPITSYTKMVLAISNEAEEVSARHFVIRDDGQYGPHSDVLYGTAVAQDDGVCYTGYHFHPDGSATAKFLEFNDPALQTGHHLV
jgi:hypothetical protein